MAPREVGRHATTRLSRTIKIEVHAPGFETLRPRRKLVIRRLEGEIWIERVRRHYPDGEAHTSWGLIFVADISPKNSRQVLLTTYVACP